MQQHSVELLRFISYLSIHPDNRVVLTSLDMEPNFISRYYTPNMQVSVLASKVLADLDKGTFYATNRSVSKDSLTAKLMQTDLKIKDPYLYSMAQTIILESFSIVYMLEDRPDLHKYLNTKEIQITRTNLKYVLDGIGGNPDYTELVTNIQDLDVALGYIQAQVPVIKANGGVMNG